MQSKNVNHNLFKKQLVYLSGATKSDSENINPWENNWQESSTS